MKEKWYGRKIVLFCDGKEGGKRNPGIYLKFVIVRLDLGVENMSLHHIFPDVVNASLLQSKPQCAGYGWIGGGKPEQAHYYLL